MELHTQIKKYRTEMNYSQEQLAEKVYVTRQTISNWENDKSYPDIHSLLLLSETFHITLDQLIKGDVEIMKDEISNNDCKQFDRDGEIFTILLVLSVVLMVPLIVFLRFYGILIAGGIWLISMFYALRIEKFKKENNIQTFKEIVSFSEGKRLDEIEKAQEIGKRPYQKILLVLLSALLGFVVAMFFVWLLKGYIF